MALAPYAAFAERSPGRLVAEPGHAFRSAFQRDRDRIVHSTAFRRLEHKTQVFVTDGGDHYRTRLTHSLEVAQIARTVARALAVDEDLAEAIALAHDLGHSPFGHAGEAALDACLAVQGGFNHNVQTLRVIMSLEKRYARFDGLNLCFETLEGLVKHNGPVRRPVPPTVAECAAAVGIRLDGQATIEAQIAAIADDVAYVSHDLDDGLRAALIDLPQLRALPLVGPVLREAEGRWPNLEPRRVGHETVRRVTNRMVHDLVATGRERLAAAAPRHVDDVRDHGQALIDFSNEVRAAVAAVKAFLHERLYRHYKVNRSTTKAKRVVAELFEVLVAEPGCLPPHWGASADGPRGERTHAIVRDYIAGMTDRFALDEHARLTRLDDLRP
ncbi:MAG: deoxyguanosinetriphosphate triphosphohydrolase [Pseudomonadota bacterium]